MNAKCTTEVSRLKAVMERAGGRQVVLVEEEEEGTHVCVCVCVCTCMQTYTGEQVPRGM